MSSLRYPWEDDAPTVIAPPVPEAVPGRPKRRGRPPTTEPAARHASSVWQYHHLTVRGPADAVHKFAAAARGAGVIPWKLDFTRIEEDLFHLATAQPAATRNLSVAGCRILARQLRARAEAHHARAIARVGQSRACPFDLHALLPVPASILALGSADLQARTWLALHWGTERLRQVIERAMPIARGPVTGNTAIGYGFFAEGGTPHAAIDQLAMAWPVLRWQLQPRPDH